MAIQASSSTSRSADRLADAMESAGVETIFSLSGNQIMPIYDALVGGAIRLIHSRHEAAAVFMAEACARTTGRVGVALVTAGPGFGNALGALYSATMSETPLILLSGDSPASSDGQGAFQEFDQVAAATPFVKASLRVAASLDIAEILAMAMRIACPGTPGPVHIAIPCDVVNQQVDNHAFQQVDSLFNKTKSDRVEVSPDQVAPLARLLTDSDRPLILCGPALGCPGLQQQVARLSQIAGAPLVVLNSPRGVRDPARGAFEALLLEADFLLYLGKQVDFTTGMGSSKIIGARAIAIVTEQQSAIDHASEVYGNRLTLSERLDPAATVSALADAIENTARSGQRKQTAAAWLSTANGALAHRQLDNPGPADLYSRQVITTINEFLQQRPDTIVICDGGEFGQWAQAFITVDHMITNGPSGAIGAALPYAIGASIAKPDRPVIAIMGDGTAGFHLSEFETAAREHCDVTVLIGNDSCWNAEHHLQLTQYGRDRTMGCTLSERVRYDLCAESLGCSGSYVTDSAGLRPALDAAAATRGPACINIIIPGAPAPVYSSYSFL